jgi:hypothetical protein
MGGGQGRAGRAGPDQARTSQDGRAEAVTAYKPQLSLASRSQAGRANHGRAEATTTCELPPSVRGQCPGSFASPCSSPSPYHLVRLRQEYVDDHRPCPCRLSSSSTAFLLGGWIGMEDESDMQVPLESDTIGILVRDCSFSPMRQTSLRFNLDHNSILPPYRIIRQI